MGSTVGEVAEGVELGQILALVFIPRSTHLPAPSNVSDGEDYASVQQRRLLVVKHRVDACTVAAVAVQQTGQGSAVPRNQGGLAFAPAAATSGSRGDEEGLAVD